MTALTPVDNCGRCLTAERAVTCHPLEVEITDGGTGVRAWYRCKGCGHRWWTSWSIDALALPCTGCDECRPGAGAA